MCEEIFDANKYLQRILRHRPSESLGSSNTHPSHMDENLLHYLLPAVAGAGHAGHRHNSHVQKTAANPLLSEHSARADAFAAYANERGFVNGGGSNRSVATSQAAARGLSLDNVPDWYLRYSCIYVVPVVIVLGILNNALVLWVMPSARVSVPPRIKRLYVAIAFFDLIAIVIKNLVYFYFEDGLYYTTNGAFWVRSSGANTRLFYCDHID